MIVAPGFAVDGQQNCGVRTTKSTYFFKGSAASCFALAIGSRDPALAIAHPYFQGLRSKLLRPRDWLARSGARHRSPLLSRAPQQAASPSRLARAIRRSPSLTLIFKGSAASCFALAIGS